MCSRMRYCKLSEVTSMGIPPAAAIAAEEPVPVDIHSPDDQTFKLLSTSYRLPPNRVTVPYCDFGR